MTDSFDLTAVEIPYSQEAEEAVIGAVLVNPTYFDNVAGFLQPDDFFILRHKYIWQALGKLATEKTPIDSLTVSNKLKEMDKLADVGGSYYLTQLINSTPTSVHAEIYGRIVESTATRRRLMASADEQKARAQNMDMSLDDVIRAAEEDLHEIRPAAPLEIYTMKDVMNETWDALEAQTAIKAAGGNALAGLPSGLASVDEITNGWQPEQFILIGGRPGMGKTAIMLYLSTYIVNLPPKPNGKPYRVYLWSGEMNLRQIGRRLLSAETSIQGRNILRAELTDKQNGALVKGFAKISTMEIYVDMTVRLSPLKLRRNIKRAQRMWGAFDLVVVDYAQLMHGDGKFNGNTEAELSNISRGLKEIAREFVLPVISGAQLNRKVEDREDKRPTIADFRGSGSLEQDADVIVFPFFESYYVDRNIKAGYMEIDIAKNRDGETGTVKDIYCNFGLMQFEEGMLYPI